jgi:hypothetical protein
MAICNIPPLRGNGMSWLREPVGNGQFRTKSNPLMVRKEVCFGLSDVRARLVILGARESSRVRSAV